MRAWLSLSDLAALQLPGLPATARGWAEYVERESWAQTGKTRRRENRGGGVEYHIDLLPAAARMAYLARVSPDKNKPRPSEDGAGGEDRDARLWLLQAAEKFAQNSSLTQSFAERSFCVLYEYSEVEAPDWVRAKIKELSPRTLSRWRSDLRFHGAAKLAIDKGAARRGKGVLESCEDGAIKTFILAQIAHNPFYTARHIRTLAIAEFPGLEQFPLRTFQAFLKDLKAREKVLLTRITNPDAFKSKYRVSGVNSHAVSRLNELWMIDASPADVLCVDGRYSVYVCIDIYSRRIIIFVSRTARAQAVALLMRRAILDFGVCERVKTDNGSDFVAKSTQRLFAALGIEAELSAPFSPEQKGHVERAIGTLQRDLMRTLPGFIGHNVKDRKQIEERRAFAQRLGEDDNNTFKVTLSAKDLQDHCDRWAKNYAQRPHGGLNGATPFAVAAGYPGKIRTIENVRALDLLLAPVAGKDGLRTMTKTGLRINHALYLSTAVLPGETVFVRMDEQDLGRAYLFSRDGERFLGEAICPQFTGINPVVALNAVKDAQKQHLSEGMTALREDLRAIKKHDRADIILAAEERNQNLVAFPAPRENHSTPALAAAGEAVRAQNAPAPKQVLSPSPKTEPKILALPETARQRFMRALAFEKVLADGGTIATQEALWLGGYRQGAEYLAQKAMFEDFDHPASSQA